MSLLLSWLSVSTITSARFNPWSLISLIVLAAVSTLASPIPAESLHKKELADNYDILAREPESLGSEWELLAREPEDFEAREPSPICTLRECA